MAGDVSFQISLQDDVSPAAKSAAASLAQTDAAMRQAAGGVAAQASELNKLVATYGKLSPAGESAKGALASLSAQIDAKRKSLSAAQAAEFSARGADALSADAARALAGANKIAADEIKKRAAAEKEAEKNKGGAALAVTGPKLQTKPVDAGGFSVFGKLLKGISPQMGAAVEQSSNLSAGLGGLGGAYAAAAVAALALAAAVAKTTIAFLQFGIESADAAQHLRAMAIAQAGSSSEGMKLAGSFAKIAQSTGMAAEKVAGFAEDLKKGKLSGSELTAALEVASGTARVLGDSAGAAFVTSAIEAKKAGKSVAQFAADAKAKLGPALAMELNRPSVALERLKSGIANLFDTSDVSGFGAAINGITDQLAAGAAVGDAFREIFSQLFGGLGASAQSSGGVAVQMLKQITIAVLKVSIAFQPVFHALSWLWKKWQEGGTAATVMKAIAIGIVGVSVALFALTALIGYAVAMIAAPFVVLGTVIGFAIIGIVQAVVWAVKMIVKAWEGVKVAFGWLAGLLPEFGQNGRKAGEEYARGVSVGINGGGPDVAVAAGGMATVAQNAFSQKAEIQSPSKVMARAGRYVAQGVAVGIEQGLPDVSAASVALAAEPVKAAGPIPMSSPVNRAGGAAGGSFTVSGVTITINGISGAETILERLPAALADAFEQISESMGISPAGA
jgi:hypothetical protein